MTTTFDFIIVGGGTSGCLLASRLASANSKPSVLLLEAGSEDGSNLNHRNPYERFHNVFFRPELTWGYETAPETDLAGQKLPYARGKTLGGSSAVNFMIYTKGSSADFDHWAEVATAPEWAWKETKERIRKTETFHDTVPVGWEDYASPRKSDHGYTGPVNVSYPATTETEAKILVEAGLELGEHINLDLNSGNEMGWGLVPGTHHDGLRVTSASANILGKDLPNLTVRTGATVRKVRLDGKRAVGIQLEDGTEALATKEIIVSAGGIDSPKLLLLSGIGPAEELKLSNIEVKHNLPGVGKNLQDHPGVFLVDLFSSDFSSRAKFALDADRLNTAREQWTKDRTGEFNHHYDTVAIGFLKDEKLYQTEAFKELDHTTQSLLCDPLVPHFEIAASAPIFPPNYPLTPSDGWLTPAVILMNPQSRGSVTLNTSNPSSSPTISFRFLSSPYDRVALVSGVRHALQLRKTNAMSPYWKKSIAVPASESDEDILEFIKTYLSPFWHASGSVKMGRTGDPAACVDRDLKVVGLQGLRVADLSICPTLPSNHPQSTAYMIGQAAAEKIIEEYGL